MPRFIHILLIGCVLLIAACRTGAIYNVESAPLNAPPTATLTDIQRAIIRAGATRGWQRWAAGVVGIAIIYTCGLAVLMIRANLDFSAGWAAGVAPFLLPDLVKALIAASLMEGGRRLLLRA